MLAAQALERRTMRRVVVDAVQRTTSKPSAVSASASQVALELTSSPRVSSVPMQRTAAVMA